jgi:prepilin-type N-terminal cleavage/methylation domain-containing protein
LKCNRVFSSLSAGFTLLEVVVAMTIVGIGVVTLLEVFSLGLRLGSRSSAATEAMVYGRQAMDEILLRRKIEEGAQQGVLNDQTRWRLGIEPVREPPETLALSSAWELKEITLAMRVMEAGRDRPVELRTYRLFRKNNP